MVADNFHIKVKEERRDTIMGNEKIFAKIEKAAAKKKSKKIIDVLKKADNEVLVKALEALGDVADEDSFNTINRFMDYADPEVRIAACKAGLKINTEYMRTKVRFQLSQEKDAEVKKIILEELNKTN